MWGGGGGRDSISVLLFGSCWLTLPRRTTRESRMLLLEFVCACINRPIAQRLRRRETGQENLLGRCVGQCVHVCMCCKAVDSVMYIRHTVVPVVQAGRVIHGVALSHHITKNMIMQIHVTSHTRTQTERINSADIMVQALLPFLPFMVPCTWDAGKSSQSPGMFWAVSGRAMLR